MLTDTATIGGYAPRRRQQAQEGTSMPFGIDLSHHQIAEKMDELRHIAVFTDSSFSAGQA